MRYVKVVCGSSVSLLALCLTATAADAQAVASGEVASPALADQDSTSSSKAQSAPLSGDNNGNNDADIVVTATKRSERLIDVPQSLTAVTSADLARLNAKQAVDFLNTVPGVQFASSGAGSGTISVRGVTTGADIGPTVGIYIDDVPYGSTSGLGGASGFQPDVALFDLDRVEVLRGPQGTLYGASSMGGLLKYVTQAPSTTEVSGEANAGVADTRFGDASYFGNAVINLPIATDKAALRASGFYSRNGGYIDNIGNGQNNIGGAKIYGGRLDLLLKPADNLTVRLVAFGQDIRRDGSLYAAYNLDGTPRYGDLTQNHPFAEPFRSEFRLVSGTISYDFGAATLTSVSSYQYSHQRNLYDYTYFYAPLLRAFGFAGISSVTADYDYQTKKFAQEVRLASRAGGAIEWQLGGFYTDEKTTRGIVYNPYTASFAPYPIDLVHASLPINYREYSFFGDLTWHITDRFDVTGGIRYSHNNQSYLQRSTGILLASNPLNKSSEGVFTYLANARYHVSSNVVAYARFATGYRPGGPNAITLNIATGQPIGPPTFRSDSLRSYEGGLKGETRDRTFSFDGSVYYVDWSNILINGVVNGNAAVLNGPGAHIKGAELTLTARPSPDVTVSGAFAYNDSRFVEANAFLGSAKGERLPNSARFTATVNADYTLQSSSLKPAIGATLRYVGDRTAAFGARGTPSNATLGQPQYFLPDYVVLDLRAGVTVGPVNVQVYVHNLTDERAQLSASTVTAGSGIGGPVNVTILSPRTIGVSAGVKF